MADVDGREGRGKKEPKSPTLPFLFFVDPYCPVLKWKLFFFWRLSEVRIASLAQAKSTMDFEEAPEELPNNPGDYEGVDGRSTGLEFITNHSISAASMIKFRRYILF
jgi:hypothetical protein